MKGDQRRSEQIAVLEGFNIARAEAFAIADFSDLIIERTVDIA
jgi:hypothetical protein